MCGGTPGTRALQLSSLLLASCSPSLLFSPGPLSLLTVILSPQALNLPGHYTHQASLTFLALWHVFGRHPVWGLIHPLWIHINRNFANWPKNSPWWPMLPGSTVTTETTTKAVFVHVPHQHDSLWVRQPLPGAIGWPWYLQGIELRELDSVRATHTLSSQHHWEDLTVLF